MGTSGAFGGSTTAPWKKVEDYLGGAGDDAAGGDPADEPDEPGNSDDLAQIIGQALQSDDPAIRPGMSPRRTDGDSGLSYGGLVGNARRKGTTKEPPTSGRRQIAGGAGRAGRAIGAGYAIANSDAEALAEYGLDLESLQGLDRYSQIFAILDAVEVGNAGPDDVALRSALVEALDRVLDVDSPAPTPTQTLCELVGTYTIHLLAIELDALVQRGSIPEERIRSHRPQLEEYVRVRVEYLNLDGIVLDTARQFEHAARELLRATLGLVAQGVSR